MAHDTTEEALEGAQYIRTYHADRREYFSLWGIME